MNGYMLEGIVNGLSDGIKLGTQIRGAMDSAEVRSVMADGLEGAKVSRAADIEANSQVGSKANAENTMTVPTYDDTRGNSYADADAQAKAAERNAPSVDELYLRDVVPKIKETYIAQGNIQAADAWDQWSQEKNTRTALKHLGQATVAARMGDFKGYADNMVKTYNSPDYLDDDIKVEGHDLIKDKDGNVTGISLKMKNLTSGETFVQKVEGQEDMVNLGLAALDPRKAFEHRMALQTANATAQAKVNLEGVKTQYGMIRDNNKAKVKFDADAALQDRKAGDAEALQGKKDAAAKDRTVTGKNMDAANKQAELMLKQEAGLQYKKGASPEEAHRMLVQAMITKLVDYQGRPTLTPEQISARATELVEATYGKGALSGAKANPMSGGLPGAQPAAKPAAATKGAVRLDMKTGQVVPY